MSAPRAFGLRVRAHPAVLVLMGMSLLCGDRAAAVALFPSLMLHELAHIAAARILRVGMAEIELMPFGGAARLENVWRVRPGQIAVIALAGPVANAIIVCIALGLFRMGVWSRETYACVLWANAWLIAFNLLPALPLDGGRVLCGVLSAYWGPVRAARAGVLLGRILACLLLALCALGIVLNRRVNASLVTCAVLLIGSGRREELGAGSGAIISLLNRRRELDDEGALPVRWLAVSENTPLRALLPRVKPRALHRVTVYDDQMRPLGVLEEQAMIDAAMEDADRRLGTVLRAQRVQI